MTDKTTEQVTAGGQQDKVEVKKETEATVKPVIPAPPGPAPVPVVAQTPTP